VKRRRRLARAVRPVRPPVAGHADRRPRRLAGGSVTAALARRPWVTSVGVAVLAAAGAGAVAGPVAGALAAVYGGGAAGMELRRRRATRDAAAIAATLDTVAEMAAELRAGASPVVVVEAAGEVLAATPAERTSVLAACEVSERTGAPLADVLDRVEGYLRQSHRLRRAVAAHRAGTRATVLLLVALPVGGVAIGYGIGADPLRLLFHSAVGTGCLVTACALQLGGVLWTERLSRVDA
jgi:tight adherence protein B